MHLFESKIKFEIGIFVLLMTSNNILGFNKPLQAKNYLIIRVKTIKKLSYSEGAESCSYEDVGDAKGRC